MGHYEVQDQPTVPHDHQVQKRIRGPNCGKNLKNTRQNENRCGKTLAYTQAAPKVEKPCRVQNSIL